MKRKHRIATAVITLIGVACFGIGFSNVCGYMTGNGKLVTPWFGKVPMAFSTSIAIAAIGLALYLTGKILTKHEKIGR